MKRTFTEESVVKLVDLDYEGVVALRKWCEAAATYAGPRATQYYKHEHDKSRRRRELAIDRKARGEALAERFKKWAMANMREGTRLRVAGCRDHRGVREFMSWDAVDNKSNGLLVCRQILTSQRFDLRLGFMVTHEAKGTITTHHANKVREIRDEATKTWFPLEEFLDKAGA